MKFLAPSRRCGVCLLSVLVVLSLARAVASPVEEVTPEEARRLAREAYLFGYPMVENYRTLLNYAVDQNSPEFKGPFNTLVAMARPYTTQDSVPSPNNDTMAAFAWLDLRAEPVVLTVPAFDKSRYFSITLVDLFTHNFAAIGTRTTGRTGGNFLITGPNWKGKTPGGITRTFPCESQFAFAVFRTQLLGPGDLQNLQATQAAFQIRTLSQYLKKPAPPRAKTAYFPAFSPSLADGPGFITYLNFVLDYCRIHPDDAPLFKRLEKIGIGPGKPFDPRTLSPEMTIALQAGIDDAVAEGDAAVPQVRTLYQLYGSRAVFKGDHFKRYLGARLGLYAGDWEETLYIPMGSDADGRMLDGKDGVKYLLQFPPGKLPPVNAFWSLSLYDAKTQGFSPNAANRHTLNTSIKPDLLPDADGGLTLYISQYSPGPGPDVNWLPAPPGPFYLVLRLYWPKPAALEGKWTPPLPRRVLALPTGAPIPDVPFDPPFVQEAARPTPTPTPPPVPGAPPFVLPTPTPVPAEEPVSTGPPAPTPLPTIKVPRVEPPFVRDSVLPQPVSSPLPVRAALPVETTGAASTPTPTPAYAPPFVRE